MPRSPSVSPLRARKRAIRRSTRLFTLLGLIAGFSVFGLITQARPASAAGTVTAYPLLDLTQYSNYTASPSADAHISMTVGGTTVQVQDNLASAQTRFAMSNNAQTVVITDTSGVTSANIRPAAYGMVPVIAGNTITFTLPQPEDFAVDINGVRDALLVFADPLEVSPPQLGNSNVKNVMSFSGVNNNGSSCVSETSAVQAAVNYVSTNYTTTPILYFPAGVYCVDTLNIGSHAQIYLSSGAAILADGNESDYTDIPATTGYPTSTTFAVRGANNVKIFGRGVVDGDGYNLYATYGQAMGLLGLFTDNATNNLTVNDLMFTNSVMWQTAIEGSHDLTFANVKFNNPVGNLPNQDDGFKINGDYNVTYTGGWIDTRDDDMTFAATGSQAIYNTSNINVSGLVLDSSRTASADIRFADIGSGQTMSGINVSNIEDTSIGRGMLFRADGGNSPYQNGWGGGIVLNNWTVQSPTPIVHFSDAGDSAHVTVSGITMSNITVPGVGDNGGGPDLINCDSNNPWTGIAFSNITVRGITASAQNNALGLNGTASCAQVTLTGIGTTSYKNDASSLCLDDPGGSITPGTLADIESCSGAAQQQFTYSSSAQSFGAKGLCLDAQGGQEYTAGDPLDLYTCYGGSGEPSQAWTVNVSGTISNSASGLCVQEDGTASGSGLELEPCNPSNAAQIWSPAGFVNPLPLAAYKNGASSLCMDDPGGSKTPGTFADVEGCTGTLQQEVTYSPASQALSTEGLCLDANGGQEYTPGDQLDFYTCYGGSGEPSQAWTVNANGTISNSSSGLCVQEDATGSGSGLELEPCNPSNSGQIWTASGESPPSYRNSASSLCLDDPGGSTSPGTFADIEGCTGAAQQRLIYNSASRALSTEGLCLDANGGHEYTPGDQLDFYTCYGGSGEPSQEWTVNANGTISNSASGLCIQEDGTASGSGVELETCNTTNPAQIWTATA
jgi:hypothetical protein